MQIDRLTPVISMRSQNQEAAVLNVISHCEDVSQLSVIEVCKMLNCSEPTASRLRSIGRHSNILRTPKLLKHLIPHYSDLYYIIRIYKILPDWPPEVKINKIVELIEPDSTRKALLKVIKNLQQEQEA